MYLGDAEALANEIVSILDPFCEKILIVGSIRRKIPEVHDIDIVLIPDNSLFLSIEIQKLGPFEKDGPKIKRLRYKDMIDVDIYFATSMIWATLVLIRTGSKEHNIRLCSRAKSMGMKLKANGEGLYRIISDEKLIRIAGDTEESIFHMLDLEYIPPEERYKP